MPVTHSSGHHSTLIAGLDTSILKPNSKKFMFTLQKDWEFIVDSEPKTVVWIKTDSKWNTQLYMDDRGMASFCPGLKDEEVEELYTLVNGSTAAVSRYDLRPQYLTPIGPAGTYKAITTASSSGQPSGGSGTEGTESGAYAKLKQRFGGGR